MIECSEPNFEVKIYIQLADLVSRMTPSALRSGQQPIERSRTVRLIPGTVHINELRGRRGKLNIAIEVETTMAGIEPEAAELARIIFNGLQVPEGRNPAKYKPLWALIALAVGLFVNRRMARRRNGESL